jgi:hypothetical protein
LDDGRVQRRRSGRRWLSGWSQREVRLSPVRFRASPDTAMIRGEVH